MDTRATLAAFDEQMRRTPRPGGPGERLERVGGVVRCVGPEPADWSGIVWSDLDETAADTAIAAQVRFFTELGRSFEWKYYGHDRPADLPERLRSAGFEPDPEEALMVADIADVATDAAPPDGIRIEPVTDAEGVRRLVAVHQEVFGEDYSAFGRWLLTRLTSTPEAVNPILALAGDTPVCSARIEYHEGTAFASLWGDGTLESWRGKGIYRATVAYRARLAAERGYRYLQVDAMPASEPILARLGFVRLTTTVPYMFTP